MYTIYIFSRVSNLHLIMRVTVSAKNEVEAINKALDSCRRLVNFDYYNADSIRLKVITRR